MITVWTKDRHDATYIQGKIDEYNANNTNNVQVDYQLYTDNFDQAVDLTVQSDELPDILVLNDQICTTSTSIGANGWTSTSTWTMT